MSVVSYTETKLDHHSVLVSWNGLTTGASPDTGQPYQSYDKELQSISIYNPAPFVVGQGQSLPQGDMIIQFPPTYGNTLPDQILGVSPMALGGWSNSPTAPQPSSVQGAWDTLVVPLFWKEFEPVVANTSGGLNIGYGPGTAGTVGAFKLDSLTKGRWVWFIPPNPFAFVASANIPTSINVYALFSYAY